MKLTFLGATHEVTGSCYYLEACGKKILVDYGMEQGQDLYENAPMPVPASQIDMVLLTHAHMDHSGLLPLLCKEGFQGQIFSTGGTASLCRIMLLDSAHIQEFEAEWKNRKAERAGRPKVEPLYSRIDAENAIKCFVGVEYEQEKIVAEGIIVRFVDAGHLLGSSSIEVTITENGVTKKIIFSGDIGNTNQPLISDPVYLKGADYVVMESTNTPSMIIKASDVVQKVTSAGKVTKDDDGNMTVEPATNVSIVFKDSGVSMAQAQKFLRENVIVNPSVNQEHTMKVTVKDASGVYEAASVAEVVQPAEDRSIPANRTLSSGRYYVYKNAEYTGTANSPNGLTVAEGAEVYLYIAKDVTLKATGYNANNTTGAGAGIKVPASSTLVLFGEGTVKAVGGAGASGGNGKNGNDGAMNEKN